MHGLHAILYKELTHLWILIFKRCLGQTPRDTDGDSNYYDLYISFFTVESTGTRLMYQRCLAVTAV